MMKRTLLCICLWTLTLTAGPGATPAAEDAPPLRRVVLISLDTLRSASLPAYGNAGATTTGIDSLAARGTLFLNCITPMGWTLPAHMAMFTGLNPGVSRVGAEARLPDTVAPLPQTLTGAGFVCGAFIAENHWLSPDYGFGRGFRQYRAQKQLAPVENWTRSWSFADELGPDASFFLFFHFMDNHSVPVQFEHRLPYWAVRGVDRFYHGLKEPLPEPRLTPDGDWDLPAYDPDTLQRAYLSTVQSVDIVKVRPLLSHLRDEGLAADTMIILTADHGEEIAEHGGYLHDSPYGEVRQVPLVVVWPGVLPAGQVVYAPVSVADIAPTVLDYAGLPTPDTMQGLSLRPLLEGDGFFPERDFLIDGQRRGLGLQPAALVAWREDGLWSLVAEIDTTGCAGTFDAATVGATVGLHHLDLDPGEAADLQSERPEVAAELRLRLQEMLDDEARLAAVVHGGAPNPVMPLDAEQRRNLEALGY